MTNAHLPAPLTPADCDLRGLPYMPLKVANLRESDLVTMSTGDEFKAAVMLWSASWSEVPAGSLLNNDRWLAGKAKVDQATWTSVRDMALHGWVACDDGRLYHPIIAQLAMEALPGHQAYQDKRSGDAERQRRAREERRALFQEARGLNLPVTYRTSTGELRSMIAEAQNRDASRVTSHGQQRDASRGDEVDDRDVSRSCSVTEPVTNPVTVTARKEKEKIESPQPPLGGDYDRFEEAWGIIPVKCRGPANLDEARAYWRSAVDSGEISADGLYAATKAMTEAEAASGGRLAVKAFHRWLKLRDWRNWAPTGQTPVVRWTGPDHIRERIIAFVAAKQASRKEGEAFAASWLDNTTTWSDVPAAIVCLAGTVEKKLRTVVGKMLLDEFGVQVILKAAGEAA